MGKNLIHRNVSRRKIHKEPKFFFPLDLLSQSTDLKILQSAQLVHMHASFNRHEHLITRPLIHDYSITSSQSQNLAVRNKIDAT